MLGNLASQAEEDQTHSPVINPCKPLSYELPLLPQRSSINNWKHIYVGWIVVG